MTEVTEEVVGPERVSADTDNGDGRREERPVLAVKDLSYAYVPWQPVVNGVSFRVRRGEMYALLGRNGAGKTTCLEVVEGIRCAQAGTVSLFGRAVAPADRTARLRTGVLAQETALPPDLTCTEVLDLYGRLSGRRDEPSHLIAAVGLEARASTRVRGLSGGERRRLDFALAVYGAPELLILDEPTTGMDIDSRAQVWAVVDQLRAQGGAVLLTTHYLEEAQRHADRIGILAEGRMRSEGSFAELVADTKSRVTYRLPRTARSLAAPPGSLPSQHQERAWVMTTTSLQDDLYRLLAWAHDNDIVLEDLSVTTATLEDLLMGAAWSTEVSEPGDSRLQSGRLS